jgi:hypothetical protein
VNQLNQVLERLKEPSTWVGLALLIQIFGGDAIPPEMLSSLAESVIKVVAGFAAILGILLKEKAKP